MVARVENIIESGAGIAAGDTALGGSARNGDELRQRALSGLFWAMLQNWSGKGLSLFLFLILARLLTPAQLGVAAAINAVIVFVSLIAELGFSDAIVQRRRLKNADINLPFFSSLTISGIMALSVVLLSSRIERWMNVPGLAPLLSVAAATLPLAAMTMFQEAIYRRQLLFRQVAIRMLVTSTVAGAVAIVCAYAGMGTWSLVVQALVMNAMNVIWLWHKPLWKPGRELDLRSYAQIVRFSGSVLVARVADVVGTRSIELLIVAMHGPVALGLYAVGAKVFQTLMQLLSSGVNTVSLGALSHVSEDRARLARAYVKTLTASAAIAMPVFPLIAATSSEWTVLLFGPKWVGSSGVMMVLMLLGALQCVQFSNGATFSALNRPHYVAWAAALKACTAVLAIWLVPTHGVGELTVVYALSQLVATPISYVWLSRCLQLRLTALALQVLPFYAAAAMGCVVIEGARAWLRDADVHPGLLPTLLILSFAYALVYALVVFLLGKPQLRQVWMIFRKEPMQSKLARGIQRYWRYRRIRRGADYAAALSTSVPSLTYIGYLGHGNVGDEALYLAFRDRLFERALLLPFDDISPLAALARLKPTRWVLLGGGTLININPYLEAMERFSRSQRPFAVFGTGVADLSYWAQHPQYERGNVDRWIEVLGKAGYIGVRGPRSQRWLREQGLAAVEMIGDPALSLCNPTVTPAARSGRKPVLGINLGSHDPVSGGEEPTLRATARLVGYALDKGFDVRFVPLHYIDVECAARLREVVGAQRLEMPRFLGDVAQTMAEIESCDYLVGQRLHATVLACGLGVPTLSLSYQPKCLDFLESINRSDLALPTAQISDDLLIERFEWLQQSHDRLRAPIAEACESLKQLQRERATQLMNAIASVDPASVPGSA
ncbi:MAG TPA: oligosaccharide flippase family protein [Steroidobacteraceae bacterium]|jgi:O-antigen/teichoic acid export membrane protein/polysaccharide pyruvyl transferase WcaK-like protein